jgi:hypothetical protein
VKPASAPDVTAAPENDAGVSEAAPEVSAPASAPHGATRARLLFARWGFAIVPAVGLLELLAHAKQVASTVPEKDWDAARVAVEKIAAPTDLVLFAPLWTDPIGREHFGDALADVTRTARPDESRFPRAIEVSIRGKHRPELEGWKSVAREKVGAITITTLENPHPVHVIDDLLTHASPGGMSVHRIDGGRDTDCPWTQTATQAGGLGAGPAVPGERFACPGGNFVGISVIHALDHSPRRCFFAPPGGGSSVLRVRFANVAFGDALHGHAGLQNEAERDKTGAPVTLTWKVGERVIGKLVHHDGEGWRGWELATPELKGQKGDLVAEITSSSGNRRHFCFEADTQ